MKKSSTTMKAPASRTGSADQRLGSEVEWAVGSGAAIAPVSEVAMRPRSAQRGRGAITREVSVRESTRRRRSALGQSYARARVAEGLLACGGALLLARE